MKPRRRTRSLFNGLISSESMSRKSDQRRGKPILPLPKHSLQDGDIFYDRARVGCRTFANPVPSHAGHLISAIFRLGVFIKLRFLKKRKAIQINYSRHPFDLRHIVVMNRTRTTIIPFDHNATPPVILDRTKSVCTACPANAITNLEESVIGRRSFPPMI